MSLNKFFKHFRYTRQVKKKLNEMLVEDDLSILTAPKKYKPHEVGKILEDSKAFFSYDVAEILVNEGKTPKDIGSVKLVKGFNDYLFGFAKGDRLKPDIIKKYIGL